MPTWLPEDREGPLPEEEFHEDLFRMEEPSLTYGEAEAEKVKVKWVLECYINVPT